MKAKLLWLLDALGRQRSWVPLLLRIVVGATFAVHGHGKMADLLEKGISATASQFAFVPLGGVLGPLVPIVEFVGGVCLILGLATRLWAFGQVWVMVFAIAFVHFPQGFAMHAGLMEHGGKQVPAMLGWEWQALLLAGCATLVVEGPGCVSIDAFLRRKLLAGAASAEPA